MRVGDVMPPFPADFTIVDLIQLVLAVFASILSTVLGVRELRRNMRKIDARASAVYEFIDETSEGEPIFEPQDIKVHIVNKGQRHIKLARLILIDNDGHEFDISRVVKRDFPVSLDYADQMDFQFSKSELEQALPTPYKEDYIVYNTKDICLVDTLGKEDRIKLDDTARKLITTITVDRYEKVPDIGFLND